MDTIDALALQELRETCEEALEGEVGEQVFDTKDAALIIALMDERDERIDATAAPQDAPSDADILHALLGRDECVRLVGGLVRDDADAAEVRRCVVGVVRYALERFAAPQSTPAPEPEGLREAVEAAVQIADGEDEDEPGDAWTRLDRMRSVLRAALARPAAADESLLVTIRQAHAALVNEKDGPQPSMADRAKAASDFLRNALIAAGYEASEFRRPAAADPRVVERARELIAALPEPAPRPTGDAGSLFTPIGSPAAAEGEQVFEYACSVCSAKGRARGHKSFRCDRPHCGMRALASDDGVEVSGDDIILARARATPTLAPAAAEGVEVGPEEIVAADVLAELKRARAKFPGDNVTMLALMEEVGELAKASFEESAANVRAEAVQVACMAFRVILDGDATLNDWRRSKGLDPLASDDGEQADG